jgi:hypothetical protein
MHDSARIRWWHSPPFSRQNSTNTTLRARCLAVLRSGIGMAAALGGVPACALACAPPPHPITPPELQARPAPLFVQAPPVKHGQGTSAHPPSASPRRRPALGAGSRKNRAEIRAGRGWGTSCGRRRASRGAASAAGRERAASANMGHGFSAPRGRRSTPVYTDMRVGVRERRRCYTRTPSSDWDRQHRSQGTWTRR